MDLPCGHPTDFDFLHGHWRVDHRRLRQRWVGADDWDEFTSTAECRPMLGGIANVDQVDCPDRGFSGMTVRVFDLAARQWSIWWVNSTVGRLEPPVVGGFEGTVGRFEGDDTDGDRAIRVRFVWTVLGDDRARWQQSFSADGHTWEENWVMAFTRTA